MDDHNTKTPGLNHLNLATLKETVSELRALSIPDNALQLPLAQTIIINSLGKEFWSRECATLGNKQDFFTDKPDVKIIHIAHMLWNLKKSKGFEEFLSKNNLLEFESIYYEIIAANWFYLNSESIEFVIPKMVKGQDFDLSVKKFKNQSDLNVEVKAKRKSFVSIKQLKSYLSKYRRQLPSIGNGVIFLKIKIDDLTISQNDVVETSCKFLKSTTRIKFIVYCWDDSNSESIIAIKYFAVKKNGLITPPVFGVNTNHIAPSFLKECGLI